MHIHVHAKCNIWPLRRKISAQDKYLYNKNRRNLPFSPVFKPHTYKLYMLRHCTYIVYIYEFTTISRLSMDRQVRIIFCFFFTPTFFDVDFLWRFLSFLINFCGVNRINIYCLLKYLFVLNTKQVRNARHAMPHILPLLSSHLYFKGSIFLSCHRKYHMNWNSFKRSPLLNGHFFFVPKVTP